jgi:hypothetical protein
MKAILSTGALLALCGTLLTACGVNGGGGGTDVVNSTVYTVGGTVSGLMGTGLILQNNNGDDLAIISNGTFTFSTRIANGQSFSVTIKAYPTTPIQNCVVNGDRGKILGANVMTATVVCSATALPETGQLTSYASGDDGNLLKGVSWPSTRFTVASSGTGTVVTDNLTGLMWQQDGSTPTVGLCTGGSTNWQGALNYVACLNTNNYLGHNDWRLPNLNELQSLMNDGQSNQATWLDGLGFANTVPDYYWSSTSYATDTTLAWGANFNVRNTTYGTKSTTTYHIRCVRGGQ